MGNGTFVIERRFNASVSTVWEAITDKDKMKRWYFNLPEFRPEVGIEFRFDGGPDGRIYKHVCKIIEVIADKKLKHSWQYEGYEGNSFVTFELYDEGDKTRLKLTHQGLDTFPTNNPDLAKENFAQGWTHIIGTSLQEYLADAVK